jgi:hypothetical protein
VLFEACAFRGDEDLEDYETSQTAGDRTEEESEEETEETAVEEDTGVELRRSCSSAE